MTAVYVMSGTTPGCGCGCGSTIVHVWHVPGEAMVIECATCGATQACELQSIAWADRDAR